MGNANKKRVAIIQSNYIPWKGYFDIIRAVDEFVILDDVQFTRRDWRNRNRIKTPTGLLWLSIPVITRGLYDQKISETRVDGIDWKGAHLKALELNYKRSYYFNEVMPWLEGVYESLDLRSISSVNICIIKAVCERLRITTKITVDSELNAHGSKGSLLINICKKMQATEYLSGPSARGYINDRQFEVEGLSLTYVNYEGYPEYSQLWGAFVHEVSILDMLFNCGDSTIDYMKRF